MSFFLITYQIMPDGRYLELLVPHAPELHRPPSSSSHETRHRHPLSNYACGWAAYAFLSILSPPLFTLPNERLHDAGSNTRYDAEFRQSSDGGDFELRGEITPLATLLGPLIEKEQGMWVPFFCGGLTPCVNRGYVPRDSQ